MRAAVEDAAPADMDQMERMTLDTCLTTVRSFLDLLLSTGGAP